MKQKEREWLYGVKGVVFYNISSINDDQRTSTSAYGEIGG